MGKTNNQTVLQKNWQKWDVMINLLLLSELFRTQKRLLIETNSSLLTVGYALDKGLPRENKVQGN